MTRKTYVVLSSFVTVQAPCKRSELFRNRGAVIEVRGFAKSGVYIEIHEHFRKVQQRKILNAYKDSSTAGVKPDRPVQAGNENLTALQ